MRLLQQTILRLAALLLSCAVVLQVLCPATLIAFDSVVSQMREVLLARLNVPQPPLVAVELVKDRPVQIGSMDSSPSEFGFNTGPPSLRILRI